MIQKLLCKIFSFIWRNRLWTDGFYGRKDIKIVKVLSWRSAVTNFYGLGAVTFYLFPWER